MTAKTPNQILSEQIVDQLLEKKLIDKSSEKRIIQAIGQGTIKESEWKVFLEENIHVHQISPDENK